MAISPVVTPKQTLPYGDRPFINLSNGILTNDAYQYLNRLAQGLVGTITNVGTVITTTNTIVADLTGIQTEITTLQAEIVQLEAQIGMIDTSGGGPPAGPMVPGLNLGQALGIGFFFG